MGVHVRPSSEADSAEQFSSVCADENGDGTLVAVRAAGGIGLSRGGAVRLAQEAAEEGVHRVAAGMRGESLQQVQIGEWLVLGDGGLQACHLAVEIQDIGFDGGELCEFACAAEALLPDSLHVRR